MYNVYQLALRAESYEPRLARLPYGKLTIVVGEDDEGNEVSFRAIAYGDTSRAPESDAEYNNTYGSELIIQNPNGTQAMAIDIMNQIKGYAYQPYSARNALVPVEGDLGDVVRIAGDQSVIAVQDFYFDGLAASDISAPGGDETDNEFGLYESQAEKARKRSEKELRASFIVEFGRIEASLSEYQRKEDMDGYVEEQTLNASIGAYIDSAAGTAKVVSAASGTYQRKDQMGNYVLQSNLNTSIGQYIDTQAGTAKIIAAASGTYQRKDAMSGYVTTSSLNTSIGQYIDTQTGQAKIVAACSGTYQTQAGMSNYVLQSSLNTSIGQYIDSRAGTAKIESAISATYQTKSGMSAYVQNSQLNNSITQYVNSTTGKNSIIASVSGSFAGKSYESRVEVSESKIGWLIKSGTSASNFTMTDRAIQLTAGTIDLKGYVTFNSLSTQGSTAINGSNITTGTIDASKVSVTKINANNITGGTIDASKVTVTNINASNITTGTISADRINAETLRVKSIYAYRNSYVKVLDTSSTDTLYLGGDGTWNIKDIYMYASTSINIGPYNNWSYRLVIDTNNRKIYPNNSASSWTLGDSLKPYADLYVTSANIGTNSSSSKIGFFGTTPIARQTLSTSNTNMGYTAATASNYLVILNNLVGIFRYKYGLIMT